MAPEIDGIAVAVALVLAVVATVAAGVSPAFLLLRANVNDLMKQGGRTGVNAHGNRMRSALVVSEVALSVVLLCGAALLMQSLARLDQEPLGFRRDHVLTVRTRLPRPRYAEFDRRIAFYDAGYRTDSQTARRRGCRVHIDAAVSFPWKYQRLRG